MTANAWNHIRGVGEVLLGLDAGKDIRVLVGKYFGNRSSYEDMPVYRNPEAMDTDPT